MLPPRTGQPLREPAPPTAAFADLPARKVLTLNMDVPEPWLVEPVQARACLRARARRPAACARGALAVAAPRPSGRLLREDGCASVRCPCVFQWRAAYVRMRAWDRRHAIT